ncbi:MAG: hypothetical protein ACFBSD_05190 [Paracoccaceae bacterium]
MTGRHDILDEDAPDPRARDVTPGWIARHRARIEAGRQAALVLLPFAPFPARLPLAALSVAAEGVLLAEEWRTGRIEGRNARLRAWRIAGEGAALLAVSRAAPAVLRRNRETVRRAADFFRRAEGRFGA